MPIFLRKVPSSTMDSLDSSPSPEAPSDLVKAVNSEEIDVSDLEEVDELEALRSDIGDILLDDPELDQEEKGSMLNIKGTADTVPSTKKNEGQFVSGAGGAPKIFDTGMEEKRLLEVSKYVIDKIPENEWNELATKVRAIQVRRTGR